MIHLHRMTEKQHAGFVAEGCEPTCHICQAAIPVGKRYAMIAPFGSPVLQGPGTFEKHTVTVEVMVCYGCRDKELPPAELKRAASFLTAAKYDPPKPHWRDPSSPTYRGSGCMVVNGQVVPGLAE